MTVGGEESSAGKLWRAYTIVPSPSTITIATISGNSVPPWNLTFLPLPFWASRAAFLVDDDEGATRAQGYRRVRPMPWRGAASPAGICHPLVNIGEQLLVRGGRGARRRGPLHPVSSGTPHRSPEVDGAEHGADRLR